MKTCSTTDTVESLGKFRQQIYESIPVRRDAAMNLLDSLCANTAAASVVELSMNGPFDRKYSSVHDAIAHFGRAANDCGQTNREGQRRQAQRVRALIVTESIPPPSQARPFWLLGVDTTPNPRPFAATLRDRGVVYQPNPAPGNKPIVVGHSYSVVACLPVLSPLDPPWVVPLDCQRVPTDRKATDVAAEQMGALLKNESLPYGKDLSVEVADSHYSRAAYLHATGGFANHVVVARSAGNRVYYRQPSDACVCSSSRGHPTWYVQPFKLKDPESWGTPTQSTELAGQTNRGRHLRIKIERWNDLLMRGHRDCPMHSQPFDLLRCRLFDADSAKFVFKRPLWLLVRGQRRDEVTPEQIYTAYAQRFDLEHFFRFAKVRLLIDKFQTPEVQHEESWWQLACLAYTQLWLAAPLANALPKPWERYLPKPPSRTRCSPTQVQRDFGRIIRLVGTPARSPKQRGISPGRRQGVRPDRRPRLPVIFKGRNSRQIA